MKRKYSIEGMTCGNCIATVEDKLSQIGGVKKVLVDLEKAEAEIQMSKHVSIIELQNSLPTKYTISEKKESESNNFKNLETKSDVQQLFPLLLIFGYLISASIFLNVRRSDFITGFMLDFMGLFYIVFSFFKFLDLKGFPKSFRMYDPLAKLIPAYGWIYPFIELLLGILFLTRTQINLAIIVTIIVLGVTTVGVTKVLLDKKSIQCACLGTALKLPMTKATFIENSVMLIMAITMLFMN